MSDLTKEEIAQGTATIDYINTKLNKDPNNWCVEEGRFALDAFIYAFGKQLLATHPQEVILCLNQFVFGDEERDFGAVIKMYQETSSKDKAEVGFEIFSNLQEDGCPEMIDAINEEVKFLIKNSK